MHCEREGQGSAASRTAREIRPTRHTRVLKCTQMIGILLLTVTEPRPEMELEEALVGSRSTICGFCRRLPERPAQQSLPPMSLVPAARGHMKSIGTNK
jgi:hypothetical protein